MIIEGIAAFVNLSNTEIYNGQDTNKYNIVINIEDDAVAALEELKVKVKRYKGQGQRKFSTKFEGIPVVDAEGEPTSRNIPYGSKVRLQYQVGDPSPQYGASTYLQKVRVLELSEGNMDDEEDF